MKVEILGMERGDTGFCAEQARCEGWNPGRYDMDVFYETDPAGWFKAVDGTGRIVGSISAVAYDAMFGFVGFFVVRPEHRGGRVGIELGQRALDYLGPRVIGQDGVFAKVANYETWGFRLAYRNLRQEWRGGRLPESPVSTEPYDSSFWALVADYDAGLFPCRREGFLSRWLAMPESVVRVVREGGRVVGYGVRRRCASGFKIGPLFADDGVAARALLRDLLAGVGREEPVYLDVPELNREAVALTESLGMKVCFGTARMYKNGLPVLDVPRIYGVTSFELG